MNAPIVTVREGSLRGNTSQNIKGETFYKYLGIPYAEPPVGDLRFKAPQPVKGWTGIKDATKEGDQCYSQDLMIEFATEVSGSEDCLVLNVFTKQVNAFDLKPVMVFIHGGGFIVGSSSTVTYGAEFLMAEDIVLVTINYRLGVLGFLSSDDISLEIPGNAGLKDQCLALQWIRDNINKFGGDPNNVTLFGESAGSASVHFHVLSPSSNGLFHKAILQSGTSLNDWAISRTNLKEFSKILGNETEDETEAFEVVKAASLDQLLEAQGKIEVLGKANIRRFVGPVIEKPNSTAFLTKSPIDIITSGEYNHVPMIIGFNSNEGLFVEVLNKHRNKTTSLERSAFLNVIPWYMNVDLNSNTCKTIVELLSQYYQQDKIYELFTDSLLLHGIIASTKNHIKTSKEPLFFYRISIQSELNLIKRRRKLFNEPGTCHADELGYLFKGKDSPEVKPGSEEEKYIETFVKLWTNFAKYSNPTPRGAFNIEWTPANDTDAIAYLDIDKELSMSVNPENERMELWKKIYSLSPSVVNYM